MNSKFRLASLAFVALFVLSFSLGAIHPVKALTPVSTLYITPNATGPLTPGSIFSVNITGDKIGSSATSGFNGWDLAFTTGDPTFTNLQAVSISTANNLLSPFGTITTLVNCVNAGSGLAIGVPGNIGCDIRDGPGVFHTAIGLSAPATPAPISGLLATVTFTVNGASPDTIGILSPCPATQGCDTLSDGSVTPVPHVTLGATIQTSVGDYELTGANPAPLNPGGSSTGTFTVTSLNLFTNTLALKTDVSGFAGATPLSPTALTVSCGALTPNPLPAGGTSSSTCTFSSTTPGRYVVTANVTDAAVPPTVFHLAPLTVLVGDFSVTGPLSAVNIPVTNTGTGSVTVASVNGFAGTVAITKTVANPDFSVNVANTLAAIGGTAATNVVLANVNGLTGATVSLSDIVPGGLTCPALPATSPVPATIPFSCTSATAGTFDVTISSTATISGFSVTKTATFAVTFGTLRDFNVVATSSTSANIGDSATSTISIINPNSGTGTVSLSDTVPAGLTCQPISSPTSTVPGTASLSCSSPTAGSFAVTVIATNATATFTRTSIATFNFVNVLIASCPASVTVPAGGSVLATCTFSSTSPGTYVVTVIGTFSFAGGSISHFASMTVNMGDFTIATASNQPVVMASGATSATAQVKLTGLFGWNRQVAFTITTDVPGLTGNCGAPLVPIPAGVLRTCTLASTTPGAYTLTVTATCGSAQVCAVAVAHSTTVTVRVQDISIQYTGVAQPITFISGGTNSTTFTVSSLPANGAGFAGTINIATTISPLTGLSATCPTNVILTAGATSPQQTCTFNSSTPNTYTVTLNATALITTGQTVKHTITITVIVKPAAVSHTTTTVILCHPTTIVVSNSTSCTVSVTDTATGTTTPTGTVTLTSSGIGAFTTCTLAGTGAIATCNTTYTPTVMGTGSHLLTASYGGDSTHGTSFGQTAIAVTVRATTTAISCHPTTIVVSNSTSCTVTVTDNSPGPPIAPIGTISLSTSGTGTFTTCTLGGTGASATCSTTYAPTVVGTGSHTLTANFNGDMNHSSSFGNTAATVTVRGTTTTVVCAPSSATIGSPTTCTVTVKDTSAGTVITPGGTVTLGSSGTGTFTGTCTLSGSTGTATCQETYTPSGTAPRTDAIIGTYPGDSIHSGSQGTFQLPVSPVAGHQTTTTISCHPTTIVVNNSTSCTVTVTDVSTSPTTPSGTVSISTSGTGTFSQACILSGTGASATCSFTYTPTVVGTGTHTLTANYPGDAQTPAHASSSNTTNITVTVRPTTTTISCHPTSIVVNNSTSCTITVTDTSPGTTSTPTGTVSLSSSGTGTLTTCTFTAGSCTVTYTPTVIGTGSHQLTASYSGDSTHGTSQGTATIAVIHRSTTTSVTCSQPSVAVGSSTTCTATVQDTSPGTAITPSGTVAFNSNSTVGSFTFTGSPCNLLGTGATATCQVTYGTSGTTARHDLITDTYSGDTSHTTSQGTFTLAVSAQAVHATATTTSCHPTTIVVNNATSCTATVTDIATTSPTTPTGTVTFTSNGAGTFTGTCTLTGTTSSASCMMTVTYTPTALGTGTQAITGTYNGDATHSSSQGAASLTINKRATSTTVNCSPANVVINQPSTCTAIVADTSSAGTPITPGGTVTFASTGGPGLFSSTTCTLIGGQCSVAFTPSTTTVSNISAIYGGDANHSGSSTATAATVTGSPPSQKDFTLSVSPASVTLAEDSLGRVFVTLQSNGFNGTVDLSLKISPVGQGLTAHLVRIHVLLGPDSKQRILLVVSGDEASAGDYTITITGTSGSLSHSASLKVTVTHPGDDQGGFLGQFFGWFLFQVSTSRRD